MFLTKKLLQAKEIYASFQLWFVPLNENLNEMLLGR